ncbi:MAG TPA: imidazolonepropionase [Phycisphaerales bacterium]|nr:imidazolonepropionase [Phycisphaerales bacterium]
MSLLIRDARVVTVAGSPGLRRGVAMSEIGIIDHADVLVRGDSIEAVVHGGETEPPANATTIEACGRVLLPGFVDCHTHACWAGDRLDEWETKLRGETYLDTLRRGGGIMATVRAVRAAGESELAEHLAERLSRAMRSGTTTIEVKSGYGLTTADELKMLRAIRHAGDSWDGTVVPTACIGHAIDPDVPRDAFIRRTIEETLPAVSAEFPGIAIDAYCERGAWTVEECVRLFEAAAQRGHPCRVHADQFSRLGMTAESAARGFVSVDHLEASDPGEVGAVATSQTAAVLLPCSGFHLDGRYANGRQIIDAGGAVALATNWNPGSAPCGSVPMAIALGVRMCGLNVAEAVCAATVNGAGVLGLRDRGVIAPGMRADLVLLRHTDVRMLAWEFGMDAIDRVISGGHVVST